MVVEQSLAEVDLALRAVARTLWPNEGGVYGVSADDLAQVGRLAVWRSMAAYDGRSSWPSYAVTRARSAMLDELRRLTHGRCESGPGADRDVDINSVADHRSTDGGTGRDDFWVLVRRVVDRDIEADLLVGHYFDGLSLDEIGAATGLRAKTVEGIQYKSRRRIAGRFDRPVVELLFGLRSA